MGVPSFSVVAVVGKDILLEGKHEFMEIFTRMSGVYIVNTFLEDADEEVEGGKYHVLLSLNHLIWVGLLTVGFLLMSTGTNLTYFQ